MTKKDTGKTINENVREMRENFRDFGQNMWYVGLGAVATVEERSQGMFNGLIEKGKKFDERDKTFLEQTVTKASAQVRDFSKKVEDGFKGGTRMVLNRFGIPTHEQIQDLIQRVDKLNAKVDKLSA